MTDGMVEGDENPFTRPGQIRLGWVSFNIQVVTIEKNPWFQGGETLEGEGMRSGCKVNFYQEFLALR